MGNIINAYGLDNTSLQADIDKAFSEAATDYPDNLESIRHVYLSDFAKSCGLTEAKATVRVAELFPDSTIKCLYDSEGTAFFEIVGNNPSYYNWRSSPRMKTNYISLAESLREAGNALKQLGKQLTPIRKKLVENCTIEELFFAIREKVKNGE